MSNLAKLQKIISDSKLKEKDKRALTALFAKAKDEDLKIVLRLFEKNPEQIEIVNNIYKAKIEALKNKSQKAWRNILRQEYKSLKAIEG